jgi:predicted nucleotidyltransferase
MCKLVSFKTSDGTEIKVADIKAKTLEQIIDLASICKKIDYVFLFGSTVEERCTDKSDIDIAIVSNVSRAKLFRAKDYNQFTSGLYNIDSEQDYDILQFNSIDAIKKSKDLVCKDIMEKGKILYKRVGA